MAPNTSLELLIYTKIWSCIYFNNIFCKRIIYIYMTYPLFIYVEGRDIYFSLVAVDIKIKPSSKILKIYLLRQKLRGSRLGVLHSSTA